MDMFDVTEINFHIQSLENKGKVSDGYHTFNELYECRNLLFAALVKQLKDKAWKASKNAGGEKWPGLFVVGIFPEEGKQITFHLPEKPFWDILNDITTYDINPFFDGHTAENVRNRIKDLLLQ
jgi:predicted DNA-binding ribbon-helix-helix protein